MSASSSPKSFSPARLTALTDRSALTMRKAAPGPGRASPRAVSITPIPHVEQTRRRSATRLPGWSSCVPQREQKRIVTAAFGV